MSIFIFSKTKTFAKVKPLDTLEVLCSDLLPISKDLDCNSPFYIKNIILNHSRIDDDTKKFIRNGIKWLNEDSLEKYSSFYENLSKDKREEVLKYISEFKWGDNFIYTILKYIMESALGDPIYQINTKQSAWLWLEHESGYPRPSKAFL